MNKAEKICWLERILILPVAIPLCGMVYIIEKSSDMFGKIHERRLEKRNEQLYKPNEN
jgi:hypothetical protein